MKNKTVLHFFDWLGTALLVNLLVLLTSFPLITFGSALSGAAAVYQQVAEGSNSNLVRTFFHHFRENFISKLLLTSLLFVSVFFVSFDFFLLSQLLTNDLLAVMLYMALIFSLIILSLTFLNLFTIINFTQTRKIKELLFQSFFFTMGRLGDSLKIIVVSVLPFFIMLISPYFGVFLFLVLGFSCPVYLSYSTVKRGKQWIVI
ncbi:DUF624 domain-containing protein [Enterococcus sp. LJL120]